MLQDSKCNSGGNSENFPRKWPGCRDWCSLGHHHPAELSAELLSILTAQLPSWVLGGARQTSRAGAAHSQPHKGSPLSGWGTSPTSDGVSDFWLFRSHGLAASADVLAQLPSHSAHTQPWREVSLGHWDCSNLGQRFAPAEVHLLRPGAGAFPTPGAPPTGWGHLQAEAFQGIGCPFYRAGRKRHGWVLDLRTQPEGIHSSIIVDIEQGICREYIKNSSSLYVFQTRMKTSCKSPKQRKYCLCWFVPDLTVFYSSVVFS